MEVLAGRSGVVTATESDDGPDGRVYELSDSRGYTRATDTIQVRPGREAGRANGYTVWVWRRDGWTYLLSGTKHDGTMGFLLAGDRDDRARPLVRDGRAARAHRGRRPMIAVCRHAEYVHEHCAEMACWNYVNKCSTHHLGGDAGGPCSIPRRYAVSADDHEVKLVSADSVQFVEVPGDADVDELWEIADESGSVEEFLAKAAELGVRAVDA